MTTTLPSSHDQLARAAGTACAGVLPSSETLAAGAPQPGTPDIAASFAGGAVVDLGGATSGRLALLVGAELVSALAGSPLGGLDLAAAVQPALDAAGAALGLTAQAARSIEPGIVVDELLAGGSGAFHVVPLAGSQTAAVLLVPAAVLEATAATPDQDRGAVAAATTLEAQPAAGGSPTGIVRSIADGRRGIELLHGVEMEVTVELGRTRMSVRELLALAPGTVLALDRAAGSPADLLVNGRLIARGEVVVVDEDFGLRVTEILDQSAAG